MHSRIIPKKLYNVGLHKFNTFRSTFKHNIIWPPTTQQLVQFIAYLSLHQYSATTVKSYLAGISFYCKMSSTPDTTQSFVVKKSLMGYSRFMVPVDKRKPITLDILHKLLNTLPLVCSLPYEVNLFSAVFTTAFFGYFRMGELVQNSCRELGHAIQVQDVRITSANSVQILLKHSKTDQMGKGVIINLFSTSRDICPVKSLKSYIGVRPCVPGSFFCHAGGAPVTRYQVSSVFSMLITKLGLQTRDYKTHSFRIGAATEAWFQGKDIDQIAEAGRWKSKCLYRYIRA